MTIRMVPYSATVYTRRWNIKPKSRLMIALLEVEDRSNCGVYGLLASKFVAKNWHVDEGGETNTNAMERESVFFYI